MSRKKIVLLVCGLLLLGLVLVACSSEDCPECEKCPPPAECPECPDCPPPPECPAAPECPPPPECPEAPECPEPTVKEVPFEEQWALSGHADAEAEAFVHWDEDDPAEVSTSCAKCHSTPGYLDFLGADGTEAGVVDNAAPIGTTVECAACHNEATLALSSVVMPSGIEITGLGPEARCMQCHQGRHSTVSVNAAIEEAGVADDDTVSEEIGFSNIHYFPAAATQYGSVAMGGYQYEGKSYDAKFDHVGGYDTCVDCHDSHTLELKVDECATCHTGVASVEDIENIRMDGSLVDYDGDGDMSEGVAGEIEGLQEILYAAMQAYGADVAGATIVYDAHAYPYFFDEAGERYGTWTARLAKAAYNYQTSQKDPGAFAHGGKYMIQLLYDSIEDLDAGMAEGLHREDAGHFAGSGEAFRHWDEDGEVQGSCAKCHSAAGLPFYLETGANVAQPIAGSLNCATCHDDLTTYTRYEVAAVEFPSGAMLDSGDPDSNLCLNCHQGRESTVSVNARIAGAGVGDDEVSDQLSFRNVHYFAAGATKFGTMAKGGYEYDGKSYDAEFAHVDQYDTCIGCHDTHTLEVKVDECSVCHTDVVSEQDLEDIRMEGSLVDYDGDGDATEGIAHEIEGLQETLYEALQAYSADTAGTGIVYDAHSYPYFFTEDGERYGTWTPSLLRGAYNYQFSKKDPGAFAHGGKYLIQLLYDSIEALDAGLAEGLHRDDPGHFAGSEEAWRHWDEDDEVSGSCAKCHSAAGLPHFLSEGENVAQALSNGLQCATCHDDLTTYTRYEVAEVAFPSGAVLDSGDPDSNLCMNCHQGRESTVSVDERIAGAGVDDDTISDALSFRNVHYFAAGATRFGGEAQGGYEYEGKEYVGLFEHVGNMSGCSDCHSTHKLEVQVENCSDCHPVVESAEDLYAIRMDPMDYDGDGDTDEGIAGEVETLREALYAALQDYAANTVGTGIVYDSHSYPYFFTEDGERYVTWTPALVQAAYNYQYAAKDPGGFAHNAKYVIQILYDSLADLGALAAGMARP